METIQKILESILLYLILRDLLPPLIEVCIKGIQEIRRKKIMRDTLRKNLGDDKAIEKNLDFMKGDEDGDSKES